MFVNTLTEAQGRRLLADVGVNCSRLRHLALRGVTDRGASWIELLAQLPLLEHFSHYGQISMPTGMARHRTVNWYSDSDLRMEWVKRR